MMKITEALQNMFLERQIYYRKGGTVRYFTVSTFQQVVLATAMASLVSWSIFATAHTLFFNSSYIVTANEHEFDFKKYADSVILASEQKHSAEIKKIQSDYNDRLEALLSFSPKTSSEDKLKFTTILDEVSSLREQVKAMSDVSPNTDFRDLRAQLSNLKVENEELNSSLYQKEIEIKELKKNLEIYGVQRPNFLMRQMIKSKNFVKSAWLQMAPDSKKSDEDFTHITFNIFMWFLIPLGWFFVFALNRLAFSIWTTAK